MTTARGGELVVAVDDAATVTTTYSDGEVVREEPRPQGRLVRTGPHSDPTATIPAAAGVVRW
ncbi:hypothetical protein [Streptomyces sampsonii]|uniref:hypothetical protein n=1 Tax=Streptomyces sampsonii TaxID=42239 RepID=UPI0008F48865|nr:hypothetical protein [Streptomyces sampsonii]